MPEKDPKRPQNSSPRSPVESCSQKAFREHGFPRRPAKSCSQQALWFPSFLKRLPKRELGASEPAPTRPPGEPQEPPPDTPRNHVPRQASGNMAFPRPPVKLCSQSAFWEHGFLPFIRGSPRGHWAQDFLNHAAEFAAFTWRSPTDVKTVAQKPPRDVPRDLHETSRGLSATTRAR